MTSAIYTCICVLCILCLETQIYRCNIFKIQILANHILMIIINQRSCLDVLILGWANLTRSFVSHPETAEISHLGDYSFRIMQNKL